MSTQSYLHSNRLAQVTNPFPATPWPSVGAEGRRAEDMCHLDLLTAGTFPVHTARRVRHTPPMGHLYVGKWPPLFFPCCPTNARGTIHNQDRDCYASCNIQQRLGWSDRGNQASNHDHRSSWSSSDKAFGLCGL